MTEAHGPGCIRVSPLTASSPFHSVLMTGTYGSGDSFLSARRMHLVIAPKRREEAPYPSSYSCLFFKTRYEMC